MKRLFSISFGLLLAVTLATNLTGASFGCGGSSDDSGASSSTDDAGSSASLPSAPENLSVVGS